MSKSHDLEEQELRQNYTDGYISKDEFDRQLKELKKAREQKPRRENDDDTEIGW